MEISVWNQGMSDSYLRLAVQLGASCIDFGSEYDFPGVRETGCPDLDGVLQIKGKLATHGLRINRVTLPQIPAEFMAGEDDGAAERSAAALLVFADARRAVPVRRCVGGLVEGPAGAAPIRQARAGLCDQVGPHTLVIGPG